MTKMIRIKMKKGSILTVLLLLLLSGGLLAQEAAPPEERPSGINIGTIVIIVLVLILINSLFYRRRRAGDWRPFFLQIRFRRNNISKSGQVKMGGFSRGSFGSFGIERK